MNTLTKIFAKNLHKEYILPCILFFIIVNLILVQSPMVPGARGPFEFDSSVFLYNGWEMSQGHLLYLDTWDNKGPLLYFINMIGLLINYYHGVWLVEVISLSICALIMYKTCRLFASRATSVITVTYMLILIGGLLLGGNYSEEFALPFCFGAIYLFVRYVFQNNTFQDWQSTCLGLTFMATVLMRPNIAVIWPSFGIVYLIDMIRKKEGQVMRFITFFAIGAIIISLPFVYYLTSNNIFKEFLNAVFIIPMNIDKPSLHFRVSGVLKLLNIINLSSGILILAVFSLVATIYERKKNISFNKFKIIVYSIILSLVANTYANSISGYHYFHYAITFVPILVLPSLFIFQWVLDWLRAKYPKKTRKNTIIFVALFAFVLVLPACSTQLFQVKQNFDPGYQDPLAEIVLANTTGDDTIQVFTSRADLYYKTQRQAASKFIYFLGNGALDDNFESYMLETMFTDIMEHKPKVVIVYKPDQPFLQQYLPNIDNLETYDTFLESTYTNVDINNYIVYLRKT